MTAFTSLIPSRSAIALFASSILIASAMGQIGPIYDNGKCTNTMLCSQDPCSNGNRTCQMCAGGAYFERMCGFNLDPVSCVYGIEDGYCGTMQSGSCLQYPEGNSYCFVTPHSGDAPCSGWSCANPQ